jgi:uncharacterized membrane protein (DUF4010 family)
VIAVLLYLKEALKSIVTKLSDVDVRAVMQFVPGVLFAIPAAENLVGSTGLYATAVVSGLTDIDAITLPISQFTTSGRPERDTGWRLILLASMSNHGLHIHHGHEPRKQGDGEAARWPSGVLDPRGHHPSFPMELRRPWPRITFRSPSGRGAAR